MKRRKNVIRKILRYINQNSLVSLWKYFCLLGYMTKLLYVRNWLPIPTEINTDKFND